MQRKDGWLPALRREPVVQPARGTRAGWKSGRRQPSVFFDLPVGQRLRAELDVGDVGVDAVGLGAGGRLPLLRVSAAGSFSLRRSASDFSRSRFAAVGRAFGAIAQFLGARPGSGVGSEYTIPRLSQCAKSAIADLPLHLEPQRPISQLNRPSTRSTRARTAQPHPSPERTGDDLWWSWNRTARNVFRRLDYALWRLTAHNPVKMLAAISNDALARAVASPEWLQLYDQAIAGLDDARAARNTWCAREHPQLATASIAYFSAEFALHQSLPIYAGGLGVLAGDHCKEASDLGVPLVGVGFMYPQGYFHQVDLARRLAGRALRAPELGRRADRAGAHARRQAVRHGGAARRPHGAGRGVARARRTRVAVSSSTPTCRRTRRGIASCRRGSTAATAKPACSRRSCSASAASGRCARSASRRRSITSTKGMPASWCCSASAICARRG